MVRNGTNSDCKGNSVLMLAARIGHVTFLQWAAKDETAGKIPIDQMNGCGDTALTLAAANGHLVALRWLLDRRGSDVSDINHENDEGNTALMLAARHGHLPVIQCLLEQSCTVAHFNDQLEDALSLAVMNGHVAIARCLADKMDIHKHYPDGGNLFTLAARAGQLGAAQWLLSMSIETAVVDSQGRNALMLAAAYGHLEWTRWLLRELRVDVNQLDWSDNSALLISASQGHGDLVRLLVDWGADIQQINQHRQNVLMLTASTPSPLGLWLCQVGADIHQIDEDGNNAFTLAASSGFIELMKQLAQQGVDIHLVNRSGDNAFTLAAASGDLALCQWLWQKQLNIHQVNDRDHNALALAVMAGSLPLVQWLYTLPIDRQQASNFLHIYYPNYSFDALSLAIGYGHIDIARWLGLQDPQYNYCSGLNGTLLMLAIRNGHLPAVEWLYQNSIQTRYGLFDPCWHENKQDHNPITCAAEHGHLHLLQWFYLAGADLNHLSACRNNAVLLAARRGDLPMIQWLHKHGVDIHHTNRQGENALIFAARGGCLDVVRWLVKHHVANHFISPAGELRPDSALYVAAMHGHTSVVRYFTRHRDLRGDSSMRKLLLIAMNNGHLNLAVWLCLYKGAQPEWANIANTTTLMSAAHYGHLFLVRTLCNFINPYQSGRLGFNALMLAAANGQLSVVEWLGQHEKADLHQTCCDGQNALHIAAAKKHLTICQWLYQRNVRFNQDKPISSVIFAADHGDFKMLKWLHAAGFPLAENGESALEGAIRSGHLPMAQWCIDNMEHAHLEVSLERCFKIAGDRGDLTALRWLCQQVAKVLCGTDVAGLIEACLSAAALAGKLHIIEWLQGEYQLPHDPDQAVKLILMDSVDKGWTLRLMKWYHRQWGITSNVNQKTMAVYKAIRGGHLPTLQWFCQNGTDIYRVWPGGKIALSLAIEYRHTMMAQWLVRSRGMNLLAEDIPEQCSPYQKDLIAALFVMMPGINQATLFSRLLPTQKQWLLAALKLDYPENSTAQALEDCLRRFNQYDLRSLRHRCLESIVTNMDDSYPNLDAALKHSGSLPIPKRLATDLQRLLTDKNRVFSPLPDASP